jgi:Outer membrane protein beta-barrel domain
MKSLGLIIGVALLSLGAASAQEGSGFAFNVSAGFTTPVGNTGRYTDMGWNVGAGAGWNFSPRFGALLDLGYNDMGINSTALDNIGVPGGGTHIVSATLDPIVHLTPKSHLDVYISGGGGFYHMQENFSASNSGAIPGSNPFLGYYPGVNNAAIVSSSINKPGVDIGMGFAFGSKWHGKFFAQAKYDRVITGQYHIDYVPVTFGFRW